MKAAPARSAARISLKSWAGALRRPRPRPRPWLPSAPQARACSAGPASSSRPACAARTRSNKARRSRFRQAVVAEDDPGARGQPRDRVEQAVAQPLVGHQPEARQRLAGKHRASYSSGHGGVSTRPRSRRGSARRRRWPGARPDEVDPDRRLQDPAGRGHRGADRRGPARFRRESGAGGRRPNGRRLRARHPDIRLHLIGRLQSNKADEAVALFDAIHSVDRPVAGRGARQGDGQGRPPPGLLRPGQYRRRAAEGRLPGRRAARLARRGAGGCRSPA